MSVEPWTLVFLVAAAFVAAFVDSIVGGGGAITVPALLAAGLPPHLALGTNKLQATGASLAATIQYVRHGLLRPTLVALWFPLAAAGSVAGALTVLHVPGGIVVAMVVLVVLAMTVYVFIQPHFGKQDRYKASAKTLASGAALALAVGWYDGFLGPGTGSFLLFGLVATQGFRFLDAAAHGRVLNFASNAAALVAFAIAGQVDYAVGLPMVAATLLGGWLGGKFAVDHGVKWIRPLFVVMSLALVGRLVWDFF